MKSQLMYVGITHETAPVHEREFYALDHDQKPDLIKYLKKELAIDSIVVLTTCNRTEVYFETKDTPVHEVRDSIIKFVEELHDTSLDRSSFVMLDRSVDVANYLIHVANGLRSALIGDKQIISQIKEAYLEALSKGNQGSLLERAFQAVFRSHRRIQTESLYKQGSTSTAYSSLKMVEQYFGKDALQNKRLLVVGAGEIAQDVLDYVSKFGFKEVFVTNRTMQKAADLAEKHQIATLDWSLITSKSYSDFDIVITAVSNKKHLINELGEAIKKRIFIDLALPSNINPAIRDLNNAVYNIDDVTAKVKWVSEKQQESIPVVEQIIKEELAIFVEWLKKDKVREFLRAYKVKTKETLIATIPEDVKTSMNDREFTKMTDGITNRLIRKAAALLNNLSTGELTNQQLHIFKEAFC
ncbi:MAG: glutamyl-tRNA reductase [Bacteroidota bacterium]